MAPTPSRSTRKRRTRKIARRTRMSETRTSPRSPRSLLAQKRRKTFQFQKRRETPAAGAGNNRGNLSEVAGNTKINCIEDKPARRPWKDTQPRTATLWPSSEPFENNCLERAPLPADYVFVPRGDVYVTRHCRTKTKESQRLVYKVYDNTGKKPLGIRVPRDIYTSVLNTAQETAESRAEAVKLRDVKDLARSRQILRTKFPLMPDDDLATILDHAFLKGSGRVGRTSTTSDEHKAVLAVEAHIRHTHTPYESLLRAGKDREDARKEVWGVVNTIRAAWEGHGADTGTRLALRSRSSSDA